MNTKINSYIGFAIKMGKVQFGVDQIISSKRKPFIVVHDGSLSENSFKVLTEFTLNKNITLIKLENSLCELTKRKNLKVLGILDKSLAEAISGVAEVLND